MPHRRPARRRHRLRVESLEDRLAPATFVGSGPTLAIDLNSVNETATFSTNGTTVTVTLTNGTANTGATGGNVSGNGTSTATFSAATYNSLITITDSAAGTSVAFANSTGAYLPQFGITLNDPASGSITFAGTSPFTQTVTLVTSAGFVASVPGSVVSLAPAPASLVVNAVGHDILFRGTLLVAGQTTLVGNVIQADHPATDFGGPLSLNSSVVATVFDVNNLTLGTSILAFAGLGQTTRITANGNITQTGALTATASAPATLAVASTGGSIALTNAGNALSPNVALALAVTGANTATVVNTAALTLGDVTLGTGALTLTAGGSITQRAGTTIRTGGPVSLTVTAAGSDLLLGNAGNRIAGAITVAEAGGDVRDLSIRNAFDDAAVPAGAPLAPGDVRDLTLVFDNAGVALPGYNLTGNLSVTAGGDVTQSAALTVPGTTAVTALGDFAITLTNPANALAGAVSLNAPQSTQPVQVVNQGTLTLGASAVGRGGFLATSLTGNITSTAAITQRPPAPGGTFTSSFTAGGGTVSLTGANDFPGGMLFSAGLTTLNVRNTNFQAKFNDLIRPGTLTDLTVQFDNASVVLPGLTLANLTVNAQGIVQAPGAALVVSGLATFNGNAFPIDLSNPANDFTSLRLTNTGRNAVTVADADDVAFSGNSAVGTGRLTVAAGGAITAVGTTGRITQANAGPAGDVVLTSTTGAVNLPNNNAFRGPLSVTVSGANAATVNNNNARLVLGAVTTGTGAFTATSTNQAIAQDPNSVLSLGGPSTFTATGAAGTVTLANRTNTFGGPVALNGFDPSLRATGAVALAASNVAGFLAITTGGGAGHSVTQTGPLIGLPTTTIEAGAGNVLLTSAGNDFGPVSISSTGSAVAVTNFGSLEVGTVRVGAGTLTLTAGGLISTAAGGGVVQTAGTGAITLDTPAGSDVRLDAEDNVLRGTVNVAHATNVTVASRVGLTFAPGSSITGSLSATAGGTLTLPVTLNLAGNLTTSAFSTPVGSDITAGGVIAFAGAVPFTGNRTLTAGANVTFLGDVTAGGTLTFNLAAGSTLQLADGTWNQGANGLLVNGANVAFMVGNVFGLPARLVLAGGTLALSGNGNLFVQTDGTLQVGTNPAAPETVIVANGTGNLVIDGTLAVGFGAVNDQLIKVGDGLVQLNGSPRLVGTGLAGPTATPVLASQTALVAGRFANSVNADDTPRDFLAGNDIVTPAYSFTDVKVQAGGVAAPGGTATGTLADGDRYTVKSSLGAAAGLVTVEDPAGRLGVVVRNATAALPSTLMLTALGGGDGQLSVGGVAVHTPGAVTVTAPAANLVGDFTTTGTLTALTARDLGSPAAPLTLTGGGPVTGATSLTARVVRNTTATVPGPLKAFKAVSAGGTTRLTARSFGTLTTTGLAAAGDPGTFSANLTSTTPASGPVVAAGTFAGTLNGTWDVRGGVGTVKAGRVSGWTLGTRAGANVRNGGLLTGATSLAVAGFVDALDVNATGAVGTLTARELQDSRLTAGSWGAVTVTGDPALGLIGSVTTTTLTATGNLAGVGLKSLTVAGEVRGSSAVRLLDGDATSIAIGRTVSNSTITAADTGTRGALKAVTAAGLVNAAIDARSIGTLTVKANLPANLLGDVAGSTVTARGNALGVGIGTVSAAGSVSTSTFDVQSGNLTKFAVGRTLGSATVRLPDPAFGTLGTVQAGEWQSGVAVLAETIGTAAAVGAPAVLPDSPLLPGGFAADTITAYQNSGTAAAVGKLTARGNFNTCTVTAERGIGTVTVGRTVSNSFFVADDAQAGAPAVGLVKTLTAGAVNTATVAANTLGTVKVTGFSQPEGTGTTFVPGDMVTGTLAAAGGGAGVPGMAAVTVARNLGTNSSVKAPFGIKALTVGGSVVGGSQVVADNPAAPAAGALPAVTIGRVNGATVRAGSIGILKVTGAAATGLAGDVLASTIAATAAAATRTGPQAIGSLTIAGDVTDGVIDAPAAVGSIAVGGRVSSGTALTRVQAGYNAGGKLGTLTAGAWGQTGSPLTTDLVSRAVGTFALKGNAARGFAGTADRGFIDVLGNAAGVGLGTFTGTGTAANSLFRVSDGDVGSFTVLRFLSSDLLVGFRPVKGSDITRAPAADNWSTTNHRIGSFATTAQFDPADADASASFADSTVVAAVLGAVALSGVDPTAPDSTAFGVAFRSGAGAGAKGTVTKGGTVLSPGAVDGQFNYLGLPG